MKVLVAEKAGFCFGVKRALNIIMRLHQEGKIIQTYGPLIHNHAVLADLARQGIHPVDSFAAIDRHCMVCIRTHGIPKAVEKKLQQNKIAYIDATCPLVKKIHDIIFAIADRSTRVIIVGDRNHPEIVAASSYAHAPVIINSLAEAAALAYKKKSVIVAQTTLDTDFFKDIVAILCEKSEQLQIFNTICAATKIRQQAIKKLAPQVDFVVIIGAKNSSNTKKLAAIAKRQNRHTFHIESSADLNNPHFLKKIISFQSVGITAGASTPPAEILKVKQFFQKLKHEKESNHVKLVRRKTH